MRYVHAARCCRCFVVVGGGGGGGVLLVVAVAVVVGVSFFLLLSLPLSLLFSLSSFAAEVPAAKPLKETPREGMRLVQAFTMVGIHNTSEC